MEVTNDTREKQKNDEDYLYFIYAIDHFDQRFEQITTKAKKEKYTFAKELITTITNLMGTFKIYCFFLKWNSSRDSYILNLETEKYSYKSNKVNLKGNNTFFYDIVFYDCNSFFSSSLAPKSCQLSKEEQYKFYQQLFKKKPNYEILKTKLINEAINILEATNYINNQIEGLYTKLFKDTINDQECLRLFKLFKISLYYSSQNYRYRYHDILGNITSSNSVLRREIALTQNNHDLINLLNVCELYFTFYHKTENFLLCLNQKSKQNISDFIVAIIDFPLNQRNITLNELTILFAFIDSKVSMNKIFFSCEWSVITDFILTNHDSKLKDFYEKEKLKLFQYFKNSYDISKLLEFYSTNKISFIDEEDFEEILKQYISKYNKVNLSKLYKLKVFIKDKGFTDSINKGIIKAIHATGLHLIINHKLSQLEVLIYLKEDEEIVFNEQDWKYIGLSINVEKLTDEEIVLMQQLNLMKMASQFFCNFIQAFLFSMNNIAYFKIIFKIFPINDVLLKESKTKLLQLITEKDEIDLEIFYEAIKTFVENSNNQYNQSLIESLLSEIKNMIDQNYYFKIVIKLLHDVSLNNEKKNKFIKDIAEIAQKYLFNFVMNILIQFKDENLMKIFFDNLPQFIYTIEHFYNPQIGIKQYLFLKQLFIDGYFKRTFLIKNTIYFTKVNKTIEEIRQSLKNLSFTSTEINQLYNIDNNELNERIMYMFYDEKEKGEEIVKRINSAIELYFSIREALEKVTSFYHAYYKTNIIKISSLEELAIELNQIEISSLVHDHSKFKEVLEKKEEAVRYNKLLESEFFQLFFKREIEGNEEIHLQNSYDAFSSLKELLTNTNEFIKNNNPIIRILFEKPQTKDFIKKEINFIQNYFSIELRNKDAVISNIYILNEKIVYIKMAESVLFFVQEYNARSTVFTEALTDYINTLNQSWDMEGIKMLNSDKEISFLQFDTTFYEISYMILTNICPNKDIISFIKGIKVDDAREFNNFVYEFETTVSKKAILHFIKVVQFMSQLNSDSCITDRKLIEAFFKQTKQADYESIESNFKSVIDNIYALKDLHQKILNKDESYKQIVSKIFDESEFVISFINNKYECNVNNKYSFEQIIELRDKSLLLAQEKEEKQTEMTFIQICESFARIIDSINALFSNIIILSNKGYPKEFNLIIKVKKNIVKVNDKTLEETREQFEIYLNNFILHQKDAYLKYEYLSFINGKQFNLLFDYIKGSSKDNEQHVIHLLNYFTNNQVKNFIKMKYVKESEELCQDMIINVNNFLVKLCQENKITLRDIYQKNIIKQDKKYQGLNLICGTNDEFEATVIGWYQSLTGNNPNANTILLCSDDTTIDEITAFIYRVIRCKERVLFFLIHPDKLDFDKRNSITQLLNTLCDKENTKITSCLFIFYSNKKSELITYIKTINGCQMNSKINMLNFDFKEFPIEVYTSDASGVGKSKIIETEIINSGKDYIYFPIGGEFSKERIIQRLHEKGFNVDKSMYHLDLFDTRQLTLMRHFLFSFLITGCYHHSESLFYLGKNIQIKIEIPYGFINYMKKFPLLQLFKIKTITITEMQPLIVSQDLLSNIQIVCNYFNNEEKLDINDIYFPFKKFDKSMNAIEATVLDQATCEALIKKKFLINRPTYYQIMSFISILANQLEAFTKCSYITIKQLRENGNYKLQNLVVLRKFILNSLIKITTYFTKGAYDNLIEQQYSSLINENQEISNAIHQLSKKESVSFNKIKPSLVFFNQDLQSIGIITNEDESSDEYKQLTNLYNSSLKTNSLKLPDYKTMNHQEFLIAVKNVLNIKNPITEEEKIQKKNTVKSIENIIQSYVFTADNYIKMILILLRIRARIPVIMMGETGCGKTSLIRMISELINNKMKILNIHAGINDEDIIKFITKINSELNPLEKYDVWVFLDEINTCYSMGLITEMMCKHTMEGNPISERITFIAACNPYRALSKELVQIGLIKDKTEGVRKLVYNVNILPHSLLNYVFDFGSLAAIDEKRYIESMISIPIIKSFEKLNKTIDNEFIQKAVKIICFAQNFIKTNNDISSVSLREVRRVQIFYEWFIDFLPKLKEVCSQASYHSDSIQLLLESIIISVYLCYYLRLYQKDSRKEFRNSINNFISVYYKQEDSEKDIMNIITEKIQNAVVNEITLPKGIAKNRALKENLFSLFVCVNNKVPIFICGKPGCSKSLSVQLLNSAMKGDCSQNRLFKLLPRIEMSSYQGSLTSTSKGVLSIFQKARQVLEKNKKIISMIFFDEMGLAEKSPNNPLKVIHSQLEYDENKDKIAFVGISNWVLDASKMNRGIFLSIPEFDKGDLIETASAIVNSFDKAIIQMNCNLFKTLAESYYDYKQKLNSLYSKYTDYHGSRDFYHLIKNAARILCERNNENLSVIAKEVIERNFGGTDFSIKLFKDIYSKYDSSIKGNNMTNHDIMKCVTKNIEDQDSRYLTIIADASISHFFIDSILAKLNKNYSFYIGSQFEKDINEEYYSVKILNKIQHCVNQGRIVALKKLNFIYPSLYDLFNQNFINYTGKTYTRIAFGSTNSPLTLVHDKFRSIILLEQKEIDEQDPPFLNRFEKQIVSFDYLLNNELKQKSKEIKECLEKLITGQQKSQSNKRLKIKLNNQLINCGLDEIKGIAYMKYKIENKSYDELTDAILGKIVPTFSMDIIAFMNYSILKQQRNDVALKILEIYKRDKHQNLSSYLRYTENYKTVVYTFSSILEQITSTFRIEDSKVGEIKQSSIVEIVVSSLQSENDFETFLHNFYQTKEKKVCIVRFSTDACLHMNHLKFIIENYESEIQIKEKKMFIFTVHLFREYKDQQYDSLNNKELISHLSTFYQLFIDNLNGEAMLITDIINRKARELFSCHIVIDVNKVYAENLYYAYMTLKYNYINEQEKVKSVNNFEDNENNKCNNDRMIKLLTENAWMVAQLIKCIMRNLDNEGDIIIHLFYSDDSIDQKHKEFLSFNNDKDLLTNIIKYSEEIIVRYIIGLLWILEKEALIPDVFLEENTNLNEDLMTIFLTKLNEININSAKSSMNFQSNEVYKIKGINLPGSKQVLDKILNYIKTLTDDFYSNEETLRKEDIDIDNNEEIEKSVFSFKQNEKFLIDNVYIEMEKDPLISSLNENELIHEQLIKYFEEDFFVIYLANHYQTYSNNAIKYIKKLLDLRYPQIDLNFFKSLSRGMLWLESNESYIKMLVSLFMNLSKYKPTLIDLITKTLNSTIIEYEISNRSPAYKEEINRPFYFGFEAMLRNTINDKSILDQLNDSSFYDYLNVFKEMVQCGRKIELNIWFASKELIPLQSFVMIFECFAKKNIITNDNLLAYLEKLNEERDIIKNIDTDKMIEHIDIEYQSLKDQLDGVKYFYKAYIQILIGKLKGCNNETYQTEIMKIVLSNNNLIVESSPLLNYYFRSYEIEPELPEDNNDDDEEEEKEMIANFISFREEDNEVLKLLNQSDNVVFDEFLRFYFEKIILLFFNKINDNEKKILGISLEYLKIALDYIERYLNDKESQEKIILLYCISYIKIYLYYYVEICYNYQHQINELPKIDKVIVGSNNSPFRKVIKIYILKLFRQYMTYDELSKVNWEEKYQISWINEFVFIENDAPESVFNYSLISIPQEEHKAKVDDIQLKFSKEPQSLMNQENILHFYDFSINKVVISHIANSTNSTKSLLPLIQKSTLNRYTKDLLSIIYDSKLYSQEFIPKIKSEDIEMWLYLYKLSMSSIAVNKSWYQNIFTKDIMAVLNDSFIPGAEINEDLLVKSTFEIQQLIDNDVSDGIYLCSCNLYYVLGDCGNPKEVLKCANCGLDIGGLYHSMIKRDGHIKIVSNKEKLTESPKAEKYGKAYWMKNFENIIEYEGKKMSYHKSSMPFEKLKETVINSINKKGSKGVVLVSFIFFKERYKWVREIDQITYRLLSLLFYTELFFCSILKLITDAELTTLLIKDIKCEEMIATNWNLLKKELKKEKIDNIFIFLNMIFDDLAQLIGKYETFDTVEKRNKFEIKVNKLIKNALNNYPTFEFQYKDKNNQLLKNSPYSLRSMIQELENPYPNIYQHEKYPYYNYFMIEHMTNRNLFDEQFNNLNDKNKYPILNSFMTQQDNIEHLSNLIKINPFANQMLKKYSYSLVREQAKKLIIKEELEKISNNSISKSYKIFEEGWNNLSKVPAALNYQNQGNLIKKTLTETSQLAFCLNDDGDKDYGKYLASYYYNCILWQNQFLTPLLSNPNPICGYFKDSIMKKMMAQDATTSEIVSFTIDKKNTSYSSFDELINNFTKRDSFNSDWSLSYSKEIIYDFDMIEEELGKIILPGKRLFLTDQRFVNYGYEGSRGNRSSIMLQYIEKYSQEDLNQQQKQLLYKYSNDASFTVNKFMFSLNMLIFFIQKNNFVTHFSLNNIIKLLPSYINDQCRQFFINNDIFNVNHLINLYEYFEHLCYDDILENVDYCYKNTIPEDIKIKVDNYFNGLTENALITKLNLATATRRFLSRKIGGKRVDSDVTGDKSLLNYVNDNEYWPKSITDKPEFENEFEAMRKEFSILVEQTANFYEILGKDVCLLDNSDMKDQSMGSEFSRSSISSQRGDKSKDSKNTGKKKTKNKKGFNF